MRHADWLSPTRSKAAIVAALLAIQCAVLLSIEGSNHPLLAGAVALAAAVPVLVATRSPVGAVALSSLVTVSAPLLVGNATSVIYIFIVVLIVYAWGDTTRPQWSFATGVAVLALNEILTDVFEERSESPDEALNLVDVGLLLPPVLEAIVISMLVIGLGSLLAITRRQAGAMVGLERANTEMALEAERHRIARDLHDVAAHHLSSIVVRTSTARKLGDADSVEEAVSFAGDTAAEALTAMRQIVTLLRSDQGITQPGLRDLDQIVESAAANGLRVIVDCDDSVVDSLGSAADIALSRVVRESLANVAQHSQANVVTIEVSHEIGANSKLALLTVKDPGPPTRQESAGTGLGVIGMRERIEPLGGSLSAGPTSTGGWQVAARLPISAPASAVETP